MGIGCAPCFFAPDEKHRMHVARAESAGRMGSRIRDMLAGRSLFTVAVAVAAK